MQESIIGTYVSQLKLETKKPNLNLWLVARIPAQTLLYLLKKQTKIQFKHLEIYYLLFSPYFADAQRKSHKQDWRI